MSKVKVPFLVRLQCRKCALQLLKLCTAYGGVHPPVWSVNLRFIRWCESFRHETLMEYVIQAYGKKDEWVEKEEEKGLTTREIRARLRYASRRPEPKPSPKQFKPRSAHEKRLWKEKAKPEEED